MTKVFISLGSNLGDSQSIINEAIEEIGSVIGADIVKSSLYRTEPWGFEAENDFVNAVIMIDTEFAPKELLNILLAIEKKFGRVRSGAKNYESRILDLDILAFGDRIIKTPSLEIPHKHMHERAFVMVPMFEIQPKWKHPVLKQSIEVILNGLKEWDKVEKLNNN